MLISYRITFSNTWRPPRSLLTVIRRLRCQFSCLAKCYIDEECNDLLPWLEHKAGAEISSLLSIGKSGNGRSLVARHPIKPGDCLLKVPYNVQLAPDNLPRGINALLGDNVSNVAKVALLILYEQKLGKKSEWDPYITRLPRPEDMHNTHLQVIADYSYAPGDQVLVRYGKFSNARLLLDFGFTLPCNMYDQVQVELTIPHEDELRQLKLELLSKHHIPILKDVNGFSSSENSFALKKVRSADAKGRGIPQSIRAFARVLCSSSPQEINYLAVEAVENDGRLARRPLKDKRREIQAHQFLLSKITELIDEYNTSIKSLELPTLRMVGKLDLRRQMAQYLLTGEFRVLKSAALWLENYCETLLRV